MDLRRRLYIQFRGEEGLDYGGVARCAFCYVIRQKLPVFKFYSIKDMAAAVA